MFRKDHVSGSWTSALTMAGSLQWILCDITIGISVPKKKNKEETTSGSLGSKCQARKFLCMDMLMYIYTHNHTYTYIYNIYIYGYVSNQYLGSLVNTEITGIGGCSSKKRVCRMYADGLFLSSHRTVVTWKYSFRYRGKISS